MSADKQPAPEDHIVAQGERLERWSSQRNNRVAQKRYFRTAEIPVESPITSFTPEEIIRFIKTIPGHKKHAITTVTMLEGVNTLYGKNYNFDEFERCLGSLFGIKKVGITTTDQVDKDGYMK